MKKEKENKNKDTPQGVGVHPTPYSLSPEESKKVEKQIGEQNSETKSPNLEFPNSDFTFLEKQHEDELVFVAKKFFYLGLQAENLSVETKKKVNIEKVFGMLKTRNEVITVLKNVAVFLGASIED